MAVDNVQPDPDSTSVNVAVRIRPQSAKEKLAMNQICTSVTPGVPQITLGKDSAFTFDQVFNTNSDQESVFRTLAVPLIDGCINGYNATIFAYGQTGSGKTFTMGTGFDMGTGDIDDGLVPRAVQYLFSQIGEQRTNAASNQEPVPEFKVVAQFLELYNEELVDLLDSDRSRKPHLRLHENAQGDIYLTGVSTRLVSSLEDTLKCLRDGSLIRSTASTNMNAQSSRSHAIFTLHIRQQRLVKYEEDSAARADENSTTDQDPDSTVPEFETLTAKFHFVDLAGSERLKRTGATGNRAKEGISINRGLLALGNVISALGDRTKRGSHVPYRDSKLTRLLQDSLGGNSRTIMIACISPSDCDFLETLNTLKYANRARNIRNLVVMNQDKTSKQLASLRYQLIALQEEVEEYRQGKRVVTAVGADGVSDSSKEITFLRAENDKLRVRVKALTVTVDTLKARNAQMMTDQGASSWAVSKARLLQAAGQGDTVNGDSLVMEEMEQYRSQVEKYMVEIEDLRTRLAEAEALAEFGQRPYTLATPTHPSRLHRGAANRVALSNNDFPDLDTSIVAAAEAGLSAANFYLDEEGYNEDVTTATSLDHHQHRRKHKHHRSRKHRKHAHKTASPSTDMAVVDNTTTSEDGATLPGPLSDVTPNGNVTDAWVAEKRTLSLKRDDEGKMNDLCSNLNGSDSTAMVVDEYATITLEDEDGINDTLLADPADQDDAIHENGAAMTDTSDCSVSGSSESDGSSSDDEGEDVEDDTDTQKKLAAQEAKLHRSLARVSSQIDSKQRLVAELQSKAAQLDQLRRHFERQLTNLQNRIRETERERDTVLANIGQLEHTGEERLRRTKEEFAKKLTSLKDEVKHLQQYRQEQTRLERAQTKKNDELRQLRTELDELRRYKIDLAKRLHLETKRNRDIEAAANKRVMELKRAKCQADNQIRSLEASHSAKDRVLQQKQAEVEQLKRKTLEQQRQLSGQSNRMTRSIMSSLDSRSAMGRPDRTLFGQNAMSVSLYNDRTTSTAGSAVPRSTVGTSRGRLVNSVKAKFSLLNQQMEIDVQRRQTSARLEHDMQTWVRERESLGRQLQRLQRRRARLEESAGDDQEEEDIAPQVAAFDEHIRNVTSQLDSVQEAISECQTSIIDLDRSGSAKSTNGRPRPARQVTCPQTLFVNCTPTELRILLNQLYEDAVNRAIQFNRVQQSETQLRANQTVWEQEREQEMEVLRLAMQHAGLPLESVDNVLSVASNGAAEHRATMKPTAPVCPHQAAGSVNGCECCSLTGVPSSAPPSSGESSDEYDEGEESEVGSKRPKPRWPLTSADGRSAAVGGSMTQSMYATVDSSSTRFTARRNLSEADEIGSERPEYQTDAQGRPVKARVRMLLPQDMLGLSSNQGGADQSHASELMPPPSGYFLHRPRTVLGVTTTATQSAMSRIAMTAIPSSAGPSPALRRRNQPAVSTTTSTSATRTLQQHHAYSVPAAMSTSLIVQGTTGESTDHNSQSDIKPPMTPVAGTEVDVFNRLTSGMSSSPHPFRGSIQPLQRNLVTTNQSSCSSPLGTVANVLHTPSEPYHLAFPVTTAKSATASLFSNPPVTAINQPLAAMFHHGDDGGSGLTTPVPSSYIPIPPSQPTHVPLVTPTASSSFRVPMECTHVARGHSNAVLDVDVVGNLMVTGSKDRTAKVWDLTTMEEVDTLRDHPNNVSKVRLCPVTGLLFTVCSYFIKVWDRRDVRKCIRTLLSSGLSQDGEFEMKVTRRQNICPPGETNIMDLALGGPHSSLTHTMFLATANSVKLWDLRRYYSVGKLHGGHQAPVMVLAAGQTPYQSPSQNTDPQLTVVTGSKDHYIKVFNVSPNASGLLTPTYDLEPPHYDGIESLVLHGSTLFSGSRDAVIKKWNLARGGRQEVMLTQAHKDWIQGLAITDNGLNLISGCRGGHLKLWNVEDCTCLGEVVNAHDGAINAVRCREDRIFTAGSDKDVRFWQLAQR